MRMTEDEIFTVAKQAMNQGKINMNDPRQTDQPFLGFLHQAADAFSMTLEEFVKMVRNNNDSWRAPATTVPNIDWPKAAPSCSSDAFNARTPGKLYDKMRE